MRPERVKNDQWVRDESITVAEKLGKNSYLKQPETLPPATIQSTYRNGVGGAVFVLLSVVCSSSVPVSALKGISHIRYLRELAKERRRIRREMAEQKAREEVSIEKIEQMAIPKRKQGEVMPYWLVVVNCGFCGKLLRTVAQPHWDGDRIVRIDGQEFKIPKAVLRRVYSIPFLAGHRDGRPICTACLRSRQ